MGWKSPDDAKVDPSGIKQHFTEISFKVHCCRYWKLNEWEFKNLSFPFWRLYYNTIEGAVISFNNKKVKLTSEKVILIPPYTPFSTSLKHSKNESLSGNRIDSEKELYLLKNMGMVDHLFIHFNLGFRYDTLHSDIYDFKINDQLKELLDSIRMSIIHQHIDLDFKITLQIYSLILLLVIRIPEEQWKERSIDPRVMKTINFIDIHFSEPLSNEFLAKQTSMSPNSFLRLFKSFTGFTLQQFVQAKRVEKAVLMMHNGNDPIDIIAEKCGYKDRQHFTKVFKRLTKVSPAWYRKSQVI